MNRPTDQFITRTILKQLQATEVFIQPAAVVSINGSGDKLINTFE